MKDRIDEMQVSNGARHHRSLVLHFEKSSLQLTTHDIIIVERNFRLIFFYFQGTSNRDTSSTKNIRR